MLLTIFFFLSSGETPADSLDSMIREHAFKALVHKRTGVVYDVPLPQDLSSDAKAAVVRLRGSTLWRKGVSIGSFRIPPRTITIPPSRRFVVVYEDLGSRLNSYYQVQNYSFAAPVLGLLAYDANSTNELDLRAAGNPIVIVFPRIDLPPTLNPAEAKCIAFGPRNSERLDNATARGQCSTHGGGHFSIVVPREAVPVPTVPPQPRPVPSPAPEPEQKGLVPSPARKMKRRTWVVWVIAAAGGMIGLIGLWLCAWVIARIVKRTKMEEMVRKAEEGEVLETVWVSGSKMPWASATRTLPVLEEGGVP